MSGLRRHTVGMTLIAAFLSMGMDDGSGLRLADSETTRSFFEGAGRAQEAVPPLAFDVDTSDYISADPDLVPTIPTQTAQYSVRIDGPLYDVVSTTFLEDSNGELLPNMESRRYWDGSRSWGWSQRADTGEIRAIVQEREESYKRLRFDQDAGAFLEGRFLHNFDGNWIQILENEPTVCLSDNIELVDGHECHIISASTTHGTYALWVDPASGYALRRALITVDADDLAWGTKLAESPYHAPHHNIVRIEMEIKDVSVEEFGGHWIATSGTFVDKFFYDDDTVSHVKKVVRRDNVELTPNFAAMGAFQVDFPEGIPVLYRFEGDVRLWYTWQRGQLIPKIDAQVLNEINGDIDELSDLAYLAGLSDSINVKRLPEDLVTQGVTIQSTQATINPGWMATAVMALGVVAWWAIRFRKRTADRVSM